MSEVRVRIVEIEGKQVAFVDRIDRENRKHETLNNRGEWQDARIYERAPSETMLEVGNGIGDDPNTMGRRPA